MKSQNNTYDLIEDYLNGHLQDVERMAFEEKILQDNELADQVKLQKLAGELVIENRLLNVKELLENEKSNDNTNRNWRNIISGLILFTIISGSSFYYYNRIKEKRHPRLTTERPANNGASKETTVNQAGVVAKNNNILSEEENLKSAKSEITIVEEKKIKKNYKKAEEKAITPEPKQNVYTTSVKVVPENKEKDKAFIKDSVPETSKEEKPIEATVPEPYFDPCKSIKITAGVKPKPSCEGGINGSIKVFEVKGGEKPYQQKIYDEEGQELSSFENLAPGKYIVSVTDVNGCSDSLSVNVDEELCAKDYAFNPFFGEEWTIPLRNKAGYLSIHNSLGATVCTKNIPANHQTHWDGMSDNGKITEGYYIFTIKYEDGKIRQGSVTIVR